MEQYAHIDLKKSGWKIENVKKQEQIHQVHVTWEQFKRTANPTIFAKWQDKWSIA